MIKDYYSSSLIAPNVGKLHKNQIYQGKPQPIDLSLERTIVDYSNLTSGTQKEKTEKSSCLIPSNNLENYGVYSNQKNTGNMTTAESVAVSSSA